MIKLFSVEDFLTHANPTKTNSQDKQQFIQAASEIIAEVQSGGDEAVRKFIEKFDGEAPDSFLVSEAERTQAWDKVDQKKSLHHWKKQPKILNHFTKSNLITHE